MLKWNELLFSLNVFLCWKISGFPLLFQSTFVEKIEKSFTAELISDFNENIILDIVLFSRK